MYLNVGLISDEYDLNTIIDDYYIPDKKSSTIKFAKEEKEFIEQNNTLKNLHDFKGKTLAVLKGFYEEEVLKKLYPEINFLIVDDFLEGLKNVIF